MPVFGMQKGTPAMPCCTIDSPQIFVKKAIQMSQNNLILDVLGIKDSNIKVQTVEEEKIGLETVRKVTAKLTYPIMHCRNCGFTKSVVIDLNVQYQSFIYRLFPNARN
ncbi:hypothetical protein [Limosilactobacillus antri]|uniref:hypothetical protein n=1 Tax=Limosilactobacillus antri TaxID=227943 RepID=UPI001F567266|nr:hypothetical protein [Limosilactobacillus antri]